MLAAAPRAEMAGAAHGASLDRGGLTMRLPKLATSLVTAMTAAGCADSGPVATEERTAAGSPSFARTSAATQNLTIPVTFTIPGGTCGLTTTVTGDGVFHIVTRSTQSG